ncbi:hypothetical protein LSH36_1101g01009 [Paralvinella palmiformis]|uniref:TIR domain-containing protein n=1 Tax=Paralvinella palmiformis TaxID=53620 RepID=A0AAD9MSI9_9ANNE|nr:hypothetical protein LSH36_1101g01009 [Paralvinella palmiformis]
MLQRYLNGELHYSSYVIYPYDDDITIRWVTDILVPKVERTLQKPQMFIKGRDDLGGETFIDEIVRGIMLSQTAIWIICPEFFQDKYCKMSANFAFHQLGSKNNLLVILENRFERYSVPKHFANMMHPNVGVARVRYTDNEEGLSLFWAKLDKFLPAWSSINTN